MIMECTQRLECTQELYSNQSERVCPEQIGFLGICGTKYPVKKGPNKIGRDPSTCNIVLNLNSISRQHAVINILNKDSFMLMDLDSANKTKLLGKTLQAYIPQPLRNGDTIQFGDIFGVFRLLEEEDDLPMTQAIDIPDTPVPMKHVSRVNAITTVPESPDVSDKDDSFIVPSQPKGPQMPSHKTHNFIKPGRTISIQPMGSKKIDNIYWSSSKKSTSLNLDDSNASFNESISPAKIKEGNRISNEIHDLETQMFSAPKLDEDKDFIYTADTQLPKCSSPTSIYALDTQMPSTTISPSIHNMNTQLPCGSTPSIHSVNTQLPEIIESPSVHTSFTQIPKEHLPEVCKINEQQDMHFDLYADEHMVGIYNAETQYPAGKENVPINTLNKSSSPLSIKSNKLNTSNDEVLFDEIDDPFENEPESQAILTEDIELPINKLVEMDIEPLSQIIKPVSAKRNMRLKSDEPDSEPMSQIVVPKSAKRNMRVESDGSTDCEDEDIQKVVEKKVVDDDNTDCEDNMIELKTSAVNVSTKIEDNFEDLPTQILINAEAPTAVHAEEDIEDMPTQVLVIDDVVKNDSILVKNKATSEVTFEDLPTQVLEEDIPSITIAAQPIHTKIVSTKEENSPFKVPSNSALKAKKKEGFKTPKIRPIPFITKPGPKDDNVKYYQDTQEIFDDLCTQKLDSVDINSKFCYDTKGSSNKLHLDKSVDDEEKIDGFIKSMSSQQVLEVIGVDNEVAPVRKTNSDGSNTSDLENTPKKRTFKFMDIDLPDSQEIKTSVSLNPRKIVTESSSESETEHNSEDQCTPIVFRKKKKIKPDIKLDLTVKFDVESLPSRVITRVRKPSARLQNEQNKKAVDILKPKFITEQESEIDKEIITENISRLKSKNDPKNNILIAKTTTEISQPKTEKETKVRSYARKAEGVDKSEVKPDKTKDTKEDKSREKERRKREPRRSKKEIETKNPISNTERTNKTTVESKDKTHTNKIKDESTSNTNQSITTDESLNKTHENKFKRESRDTTNSSVETKRSRRPRQAKTVKKEKSPSPEKERPKRKNTRKPTKSEPQKEEKKLPSPEKEIRRSKRQRAVKEEVNKKETPKSILKKSVPVSEESAVYNISSSSSESRSKRQTGDDSEGPTAKRSKLTSSNDTSRASPAPKIQIQYVLFTALPAVNELKGVLEKLGAVIVTDVTKCTVLLTQDIKRTFKLLCAVGLGKPIVGPNWVQACVDNKTIVDPWPYLIKDKAAESRFHFTLESALAGKRNFLKGINVSSTPSVMPKDHEMKLIVECSGGTWATGGERWVAVSVATDRALWPALRRRGATVVSPEFILGGVLRQRLDIEANKFD